MSDGPVAYDRQRDVVMIKRMLIAIVGVVAAAVAIAAATHAVDFENSTIEDGAARFVIALAAGVVFLVCLSLLISSLSEARWSKALHQVVDDAPNPIDESSSLANRFAASQAAERSSTSKGLFGISHPNEQRPNAADGLFGHREPEHPPTAPVPPLPEVDAEVNDPSMGRSQGPPPLVDPPETSTAQPPTEAPPAPEPITAASVAPRVEQQPIALRDYHPDNLDSTFAGQTTTDEQTTSDEQAGVDEQKSSDVDSLPASGSGNSDAPLTAQDIRTMLFVTTNPEPKRATPNDARGDEPQLDLVDPSADIIAPAEVQHPDDALPTWQVIDDPADGVDDDGGDHDGGDHAGDSDPPSTGYLYATGGA